MTRFSALGMLLCAVAACTTGEPASPGLSSGAPRGGETTETPETAGEAETGDPRAGGPAAPTPPGGLTADCAGSSGESAVPSTPAALQTWLRTRAYTCWARESAAHPSAGPHGGNVRVYLNGALDRSLADGADEHPPGSVAVKELFGSGKDTVTGWAVGVKTSGASDGGRGWYWYEAFDTNATPSSTIEGQGKPLCSSCHAAGRDFVLVPHPLR